MSNYTICAYMRLSDEDRDIFGRKVESGSITSQRRLIMDYINRQPDFRGCPAGTLTPDRNSRK